MENIIVQEIEFTQPKNQSFDKPLRYTLTQSFDLTLNEDKGNHILTVYLFFEFLNPITMDSSLVNIKIPVEFSHAGSIDADVLYLPFHKGFEEARVQLSNRFINSNIGYQPDEFRIPPFNEIETDLIQAITNMSIKK